VIRISDDHSEATDQPFVERAKEALSANAVRPGQLGANEYYSHSVTTPSKKVVSSWRHAARVMDIRKSMQYNSAVGAAIEKAIPGQTRSESDQGYWWLRSIARIRRSGTNRIRAPVSPEAIVMTGKYFGEEIRSPSATRGSPTKIQPTRNMTEPAVNHALRRSDPFAKAIKVDPEIAQEIPSTRSEQVSRIVIDICPLTEPNKRTVAWVNSNLL
jgi:hypothetical protein